MQYDCRTLFQLSGSFTPFLDDNSAAISFSRNTRKTSRSKHIDVLFYFVKEKVAESLIPVEYTPMTSMLCKTREIPISRKMAKS